MRTLIISFLLFAAGLSATAQIKLDTVYSQIVGPGVRYTAIYVASKPWTIDVLQVDAKNPYSHLETVKAKDKLPGLEKTSSMAFRKSYPGHMAIGAVNADFFDTQNGVPISSQIQNGELLKKPYPRINYGFDYRDYSIAEQVSYTGLLKTKTSAWQIPRVNEGMGTNTACIYNSFFGTSTQTIAGTAEILVHPLNGWYVNDTLKIVVDSFSVAGNMSIPKENAVISANGTVATDWQSKIKKGDTLALYLNLSPGIKKLTGMVGASHKIITGGINTGHLNPTDGFSLVRHPRTAVGFSQDSSKIWLVTVDGRTTASIGATLPELADIMIQLGVYTAVNLDGGGSTTMVVRDSIKNTPSDATGERPVSNIIMVVSTAPAGSLSYLRIEPDPVKMIWGEQQKLDVTSWNQYDDLMAVNPTGLQWSLGKPIGTISPDGVFTANGTEYQGYLYASLEGKKDSVLITIQPVSRINLQPDTLVIDSLESFTFRVKAYDPQNKETSIGNASFSWFTPDTVLGKVDPAGIFKGKTDGQLFVFAKLGNFIDSSLVLVEAGEEFRHVDPMLPEGWTVSLTNMDSVKLSSHVQQGSDPQMKLDYYFTYQSKTPSLFLYKTIRIYGLPDSIWLGAKLSGKDQRISFKLNEKNGKDLFAIGPYVKNPEYALVGMGLTGSTAESYPLSLEYIRIEFKKDDQAYTSGKQYSGSLFLGNLLTSYPGHHPYHPSTPDTSEIPDTSGQAVRINPLDAIRIYPNPAFNSITVHLTSTSDECVISVFDALGNTVIPALRTTQFSTPIDISGLSEGIYFLRVNQGQKTFVRRFVRLAP